MEMIYEKNKEKNKKRIALDVIFPILILFIYSLFIWKMPYPFIPDEVGYWGNAAYFAGVDWKSCMTELPYYGYGYSILLAPLFALKNSKIMYIAALILNIIMVEIEYILIKKILVKFFLCELDLKIQIAAFISVLYPPLLVYSHMTMVETMVCFLFTVLMLFVQDFLDNPRCFSAVCISLVLGYMIAIHLRNLFLAPLVLGMMIIHSIHNKDYKGVVSVIIFVSVLAIVLWGKNILVENVYTEVVSGNSEYNDVNDNMASRLWFLSRLLDVEWWRIFFINIISRILYFSYSTCFLLLVAVKRVALNFKENLLDSRKWFEPFLLILLIIIVLFQSVSMYAESGYRLDFLCYGRYGECVMPLFCAIATYSILNEYKNKAYEIAIVLFFFLAISKITYNHSLLSNYSGYQSFIPLMMSGISWTVANKPVDILSYLFIISTFLYLIGIFAFYFIKKKGWVIAFIALFWVINAYLTWFAFGLNLNETAELTKNSRVLRMDQINEVAEFIKEKDIDTVYYVYENTSDGPDHYDMFTIQFDLKNVSVCRVKYSEIESIDKQEAVFLVNYSSPYYWKCKETMNVLLDNPYFLVCEN